MQIISTWVQYCLKPGFNFFTPHSPFFFLLLASLNKCVYIVNKEDESKDLYKFSSLENPQYLFQKEWSSSVKILRLWLQFTQPHRVHHNSIWLSSLLFSSLLMDTLQFNYCTMIQTPSKSIKLFSFMLMGFGPTPELVPESNKTPLGKE